MATDQPATAAPVAFTDVVEGCTCDECMEGEPVADTAAHWMDKWGGALWGLAVFVFAYTIWSLGFLIVFLIAGLPLP